MKIKPYYFRNFFFFFFAGKQHINTSLGIFAHRVFAVVLTTTLSLFRRVLGFYIQLISSVLARVTVAIKVFCIATPQISKTKQYA